MKATHEAVIILGIAFFVMIGLLVHANNSDSILRNKNVQVSDYVPRPTINDGE